MYFQVLGPLELCGDSISAELTAAKPRTVLALLLANGNAPVPTATLIEELWGDEPPTSALTTLQTYIFQLRKLLNRAAPSHGAPAKARQILVTKPISYLLRLEPDQSDLLMFRRLVREGREAMEHQQFERASALLRQAIGLWRGEPFADVQLGSRLRVHAIELQESRLTALEWCVEVDMRLGRHRELISELTALIAEYPLHEGLYSQLMLALCLSGRRSEALDIYQRLRSVLVRDLGLEPSWSTQHTQQVVLRAASDAPPNVRELFGEHGPTSVHRVPPAAAQRTRSA